VDTCGFQDFAVAKVAHHKPSVAKSRIARLGVAVDHHHWHACGQQVVKYAPTDSAKATQQYGLFHDHLAGV
jgi:hypothetical protein